MIFLPPLLFYAAFNSSLRDLRADARAISLTSIGLVLATTCAVAVIAHEAIDGMPWAMAFALGAIVSPTDPVAATAIMRRLSVPRRLVTVIEGESLVNDASALIAYRVAVAAAVGGSFSLGEAALDFVVAAGGGVAVGLAAGWVIGEVRRRLDDPPTEITVSLLTGYAAYVPAEQLGLSGVLAAVTAGLYIGRLSPEISSGRMRIQGFATWDVLVFVLNATLFLLIGLQLNTILDGLSGYSTGELLGYATLVAGTVIVTRIVWSFTMPYVIRALDRRPSQRERRAGSGVPDGRRVERDARRCFPRRGARAAARDRRRRPPAPARPDPVPDVRRHPRDARAPGPDLPALIRAVRIRDDGADREREELRARLVAARAALAALDGLVEQDWTRDDTIERMRNLYDYRLRRFGARAGKVPDDGYEDRSL